MSEPELIGVGASPEVLVKKIERITEQRKRDTAVMKTAWEDGRLPAENLPCHDRCDGNIVTSVEGVKTVGMCPAFMLEGVCPIVHRHEKEMTARMVRAGFGAKYHKPDPTRIRCLQAVNDYLAHGRANITDGRGLILSGAVGVGKTMALGYLGRQLMEDGAGVWMAHMPRLIEDLADRQSRRMTVERAIKVEVFMLDDFGSGDIPTWVLGVLEGIVEHRYANNRPMIVTTNLERGVFVRVPEFRRMVDRWREKCRWVTVGGDSQRHGAE